MAELEIIKIATGKRLTIALDGSELRDQIDPPQTEWCDRGQHQAIKLGGRDDYGMLWVCAGCK